MLEPVFDFIEKFATDFTWKRLFIFVSLISLLGATFFIYEAQTAANQLNKYEKTINLLEKLNSLDLKDERAIDISKNIYSGLLSITKTGSDPATFNINISTEIKQAFLAASPWLLFCLFFIPAYLRKDEEAPSIVGGTMALAVIMGLGGYLIPVSWGAWVGFGIFPFGVNLLILILLMWFGNRDKS